MVTRTEEWCIEAETLAREARELLAVAVGLVVNLGERVHVELDRV
jgi:hypothetical protein